MESVAGLSFQDQYFRKPVKQHVYEFAAILAVVSMLYGALMTYKYSHLSDAVAFTTVGIMLVAVGKIFPRLLFIPWKAWMTMAQWLGFIMTYVVLTVCWFAILVPTSLIMRVFGISVMDTQFGAETPTYWKKRDPKKDDPKFLERQF